MAAEKMTMANPVWIQMKTTIIQKLFQGAVWMNRTGSGNDLAGYFAGLESTDARTQESIEELDAGPALDGQRARQQRVCLRLPSPPPQIQQSNDDESQKEAYHGLGEA